MISECITHDQILKGILAEGCAEELGYVLGKFTVHHQ